MIDQFARRITYLRLSVIDRCNLACVYCMPKGGLLSAGSADQLTIEEIERLARIFASLGIRKVRLTGGEPTLRRGIEEIVARIKNISGIREIVMTTNGIVLSRIAQTLRTAGLDRVNISLDTLDRAKFRRIAGPDRLADVLESVDKALEAGLRPVKLNTVVMRGINDEEVVDLLRFAVAKEISIRFIEVMPTHQSVFTARERLVPSQEVKEKIEQHYELENAPAYAGSPSRDFWVMGTRTMVGFISPLSNFFCAQCNRIRLKANGGLKTCLHGEESVNLRKLLREGSTDGEVAEVISRTVYHRAAEHFLNNDFVPHKDFFMSQVGG